MQSRGGKPVAKKEEGEMNVEQVEWLREFLAEIAAVCNKRKLVIRGSNIFTAEGSLIASGLETFPGRAKLMAFDEEAKGGMFEIHGEQRKEYPAMRRVK